MISNGKLKSHNLLEEFKANNFQVCFVEEIANLNSSISQNAFHFDNLQNRTVTLMEVPYITMTIKNDYRCLLGGDHFEIDINYSSRRFLAQIPVIKTTNDDLDALLTSLDRAAPYSKVNYYSLNEQITSELIKGTIPMSPVTLCVCHLKELFKCRRRVFRTRGTREFKLQEIGKWSKEIRSTPILHIQRSQL